MYFYQYLGVRLFDDVLYLPQFDAVAPPATMTPQTHAQTVALASHVMNVVRRARAADGADVVPSDALLADMRSGMTSCLPPQTDDVPAGYAGYLSRFDDHDKPGEWRVIGDDPETPLWGDVVPVLQNDDTAQIDVPPLPDWDDPAFDTHRAAFADLQETKDRHDRRAVRDWLGDCPSDELNWASAHHWHERLLLELDGQSEVDQVAAWSTYYAALDTALIHAYAVAYEQRVARPVLWHAFSHNGWEPDVVIPPVPAYPDMTAVLAGVAATTIPNVSDAEARAIARLPAVAGVNWLVATDAGYAVGVAAGEATVNRD